MHPAQQLDQPAPLLLGKIGERLAPDRARQIQDARENRAGLFGQHQPAGAAVGRIEPALDPAILLHAVDLADEGHRLDLEQVGETGLVDAFVAREIAENPALRAGQAEKHKRPLVKAPREQPRHVVREIPKAAVEVHGRSRETTIRDNKLSYEKL